MSDWKICPSYTEIPTFEIDEEWSAREQEPMHKVGRLFRGDYYIEIAISLMGKLVAQFYRNCQKSGFDVVEIERKLAEQVKKEMSK